METSDQLLNIDYATGIADQRSTCMARFIGGSVCGGDILDLQRYCFFHRFQHEPDGQCQLVIAATYNEVTMRCSKPTEGIMCNRHTANELDLDD